MFCILRETNRPLFGVEWKKVESEVLDRGAGSWVWSQRASFMNNDKSNEFFFWVTKDSIRGFCEEKWYDMAYKFLKIT